jgi:hypothetical protein
MNNRPRNLLMIFAFSAVLLIGSYIYFYQFSSLPVEQSDLFLNLISLLAPLSSAIFATMVFLSFKRGDKPRKVWKHLTIFIWLWTTAEFIWVGYLIFAGDVPLPSLADFFWLTGFIFLAIALHRQYQIVTLKLVPLWQILSLLVGVFVLAFLVLLLSQADINLGNYLEYFYAVTDFTAGIIAIRIFLAFRGGLMSRPWIGLFVLGLSDALYAWLLTTDMYAMSQGEGNPLSMIADTSYMAAYLVLAIGFFATYLTLKYGPGARPQPTPIEAQT